MGKKLRKALYLKDKLTVDKINARLGLEPEESDVLEGLYFLAPFGADDHAFRFYWVITPEEFNLFWSPTGKTLDNDFIEVEAILGGSDA